MHRDQNSHWGIRGKELLLYQTRLFLTQSFCVLIKPFKEKLHTINMDDWNAFAMELWGLSIAKWTPIPEREGKLPKPLEYDVLQDGLVELGSGQRHMVLQCLSCYQVIVFTSDLWFVCIAENSGSV